MRTARALVTLLLAALCVASSSALCPQDLAAAVQNVLGQPIWQRAYIVRASASSIVPNTECGPFREPTRPTRTPAAAGAR